jgi:hypothetical protein
MKTITQKIEEDIASPFWDIDVLNVVVHRLAVIYDEARLPGYLFRRGDYFVTDGSGTCVYRPVNADYERVWAGGEWVLAKPPSKRTPKGSRLIVKIECTS